MASVVWRKVLASRAAPILILLCLGGLAYIAFAPDAGVLEDANVVVERGALMITTLAILAVLFLGGTEIALELQDRTAMFWMSHPIARWRYVMGKILGSCVVGWSLLVVLGAASTVMFLSRGIIPGGAFYVTLGTNVPRVLLLSALLTFLSTSMSYMQATFVGGVICLMGYATYAMPIYIRLMGFTPGSGLFWLIYYLIPNWEHFSYSLDFGVAAVGMSFWVYLGMYSLAYAVFFSILAILAFQWKDIT
jgi:ABC-type transport system involved in multi-copper enzyme maturation permease subunit